jgi:hypothetical protein
MVGKGDGFMGVDGFVHRKCLRSKLKRRKR